MFKMILAVSIGILLVGCIAQEKKEVPRSVFVSGMNVPRSALLTVRGEEIIKTYKTGRYIDQDNPNIMHEAGEMYVIRRSSSWNTRPNAPVTSPAFTNRLELSNNQPVNIQLENMKKQQALLAKTNQSMRQLGTQMLKSRKEINKLGTAQSSKDSKIQIKQLKKEQQKIIIKLAELETLKFKSLVPHGAKIINKNK